MTNLTEKDNRLFATDCAALVHHIWQREYPTDSTVRTLIERTRSYIGGKATAEELEVAGAVAEAAGAGWGAANADEAAARAAVRAAWAAKDTSDAIWDARAVWAVAAAAGAAVRYATWAAGADAGASWGSAAVNAALNSRREEYINGTAGEPWEIDNGERLKEIVE